MTSKTVQLRTRPEWEESVAEAKRAFPSVPAQFFEQVGDLAIREWPRVDAQLVGELAQVFHEASMRRDGIEPEPAASVPQVRRRSGN